MREEVLGRVVEHDDRPFSVYYVGSKTHDATIDLTRPWPSAKKTLSAMDSRSRNSIINSAKANPNTASCTFLCQMLFVTLLSPVDGDEGQSRVNGGHTRGVVKEENYFAVCERLQL